MARRKTTGKFVCIEGVDGCGKTTQAKLLVRNLRRRGFDAVYTTEPSVGKVGKLIRSYVLDRERRVPIALEALLFAADRVDHVETEVEPLLKQGKIVVCDRYIYSSLAYQGAGGLDLDWIDCINLFALKPDLALLLDVLPDVVVGRLKKKKSVMENMRNLRKVRDVYLELAQRQRMISLDGDKPIKEVAKDILKTVLEKLKA
ncbi:MAG TPA: dTMP kinase [Candidatus Bathyarchaeia archaeon]|nr:dTMP kinase [Candidatus Bathyarchaeia archaeon]